MSSAHRIANAVNLYPSGDVEKYFEKLDAMLELNSGNNDFRMVSHDSYAVSCPVPQNGHTKFRITDSSMDIVDISQGYLELHCTMDLTFNAKNANGENIDTDGDSPYRNNVWFFVGFKSGAHILSSYNVYSNGRLTACKQTKAKQEQTIVFNCKAREEKAGRPGMYTVHEDVLKMRDCICGYYIQQPTWAKFKSGTIPIEFDVIIQIDDLLPFSAMSLFPRFAIGELELEISADLSKNMVFCPIPLSEVLNSSYGLETLKSCTVDGEDKKKRHEKRVKLGLETTALTNYGGLHRYESAIHRSNIVCDSRFHQCGDYARCLLGIKKKGETSKDTSAVKLTIKESGYAQALTVTKLERDLSEPKDCYVTIVPSNLVMTKCRSYVFGFGIKDSAKANLKNILYEKDNLTFPAQWIEHSTFPQQISGTEISVNTIMSLFECSQLIVQFPNTPNQLTVSRNPHLNKIRCQIADKMIPDKDMGTADKSFVEMTLTSLGLDSLFSADKSLINSLNIDPTLMNVDWVMNREDDSDFMFVADLERNGAGTYSDGMTASNCSVNFTASMMGGDNNPHYKALNVGLDDKLKITGDTVSIEHSTRHNNCTNPNIYLVEDAYWVAGPDGIEFIKDSTTVALTTQREQKIREAHQNAVAEANIEARATAQNYQPFNSGYRK